MGCSIVVVYMHGPKKFSVSGYSIKAVYMHGLPLRGESHRWGECETAMNYKVYILKSLIDNKRYIGSTNDLPRRLIQHNSGQVTSTKNRRPLVVIYTEDYGDEKPARIRE